jgi:hypothetical protein|tara:strand:+ start:1719 stop:2723 length:1005 start_codon:yes stop_codon:yes gene_type:complete
MSIASQANINLLNGGLASAWSNGKPNGNNELVPSVVGNALEHPTLDVAESNPPFGSQFAGITYFDDWGQLSQLYTNTTDTQTFVGNNFLANFPAFKDLGSNLDDQKKVLKLFGSGSDFGVTSGDNSNNNNSRSYTGNEATNRIPLVGMSETTTIGSFPDNTCWCRNEWTQSVDIPNSATKVTFGAYIRVPSDDDFRAKNCGGIYIAQWTNLSYPTFYTINAITAKRSADSFTFLTGSIAQGLVSQQNWSGLRPDFKDNSDKRRWNDSTTIQSVDYVSSSDYRQFRKVEKEVTLAGGTNRKMTFNLFFGENQGNIDGTGTATGSIHFYQPFVIFS